MSSRIEPYSIPVDTYLKYALFLTPKEKELIKEFSKWLPNEIVDAHVHSNTRSQCNFIEDSFRKYAMTTFPWFEITKHFKINRIFYPEKRVRMLLFPMPFRGINYRAANNYISRQAIKNPLIIPILYGLPDDFHYTISKLKSGNFYGLKIYPAYFSPPVQKISEYFPKQILKHCEEMSIPIILHLPQRVVKCKKELNTIAKKFSELKIVLAHMGLVYFPLRFVKKVFSLLSQCHSNIYLDTAMVTSADVFKIALDTFGYHRIIFGTDQPFNLIRGLRDKNIALGMKIIPKYAYHWADCKEQEKYSQDLTGTIHFHWQMLSSLRKAISAYGEDNYVKNYIFRENAKRIFMFH